ncbi:MAG: SusC/RagA family TonB-linked outer membrane protein [Cytophagales bacterium]|nr:SusC/RagA family TonB-linked outer membrane protein [Cytophagales bacterium]
MKRKLKVAWLAVGITGLFSFCALPALAQSVSGRVTDQADQSTMPGVNVLLKGTTKGTTTDASGRYTLELTGSSDVLVFSFIGYVTQEVAVNGRSVIDLQLEPSTAQLEEVIVVGYSEKRKSEITGAVVNVSAEKLKGVTGSNLAYQLQGKVAGVQVTSSTGAPGAPSEIRIRGNSSIGGDNGPLYVVDGIVGGAFNPNDVESITVLKDAGAVALYGSRANQGVIVVTTKKGKSEQAEIAYSTSVGVRNVTSGKFKVMDSQELYDTERAMFASSAQFQTFRPASLLNTNTDWLGLAYKQGVIQNHNLSARGKSGKVAYFIAGDYYNEEGTLLTTGYERYNFRTNLDFALSKDVQLTTNLNITRDMTNSYHWRWPYQPFLYLPYDTPYGADGNIRYVDATTSGFLTRDKNNILHSAQYNDYKNKGLSLNGDAILTINITPWLTAQSRNRIAFATYRSDSYEDSKTIEGAANKGILSFGVSEGYGLVSTNMLRASKDFGLHQLGGFVGIEGQKSGSETAGAGGYGIVSGIKIPGGIASPQSISGGKSEENAISVLTEVNYNFNEKYFASVSYRRDGSSKFGANKRWGNFGAVSASWIVSKENFISSVKSITFFKVRTSYGILGNDAISPFQYLAKYNFTTQYNGGSAGYPETLPNPDLGWEQTKAANVGIDAQLFKKIDITLDAFNKNTDQLLFYVPLAPSQGIARVLRNAGRLVTQGIELGISGDVMQKGSFTWNIGFNIGSAQNEVKELADGVSLLTRDYDGVKQAVLVGHDVNTWYLPKWMGVNSANGEPQWEYAVTDASGNVTGYQLTNQYAQASASTSLQAVGSATPKFYGGLSTSLSYQRFTLSVASAFQYGNLVYHRTREFLDADGANFNFNMMSLADGWSRWRAPGDVATHPKPVYGGNLQSNKPSSRYLEDGSFWRIRNIMLTYAIPTSILNRLKLSRANVFLSGDNLFTFTKFSGMDPEIPFSGIYGMSDFKYPISKQYLAGLQVTF